MICFANSFCLFTDLVQTIKVSKNSTALRRKVSSNIVAPVEKQSLGRRRRDLEVGPAGRPRSDDAVLLTTAPLHCMGSSKWQSLDRSSIRGGGV